MTLPRAPLQASIAQLQADLAAEREVLAEARQQAEAAAAEQGRRLSEALVRLRLLFCSTGRRA